MLHQILMPPLILSVCRAFLAGYIMKIDIGIGINFCDKFRGRSKAVRIYLVKPSMPIFR